MAEFKIGRLRFTWKGQWAVATFYNKDAVVQHEGKTYVCLVAHTSADFNNELTFITPSGASTPYWTLMLDGKKWFGDWQPITAYALGNIVRFGGSVYTCTVAHTSDAVALNPAKFTLILRATKFYTVWSINTAYGLGDQVKYGGIVYDCITPHLSASSGALGLEANQSSWQIAYRGIEYKGVWVTGTRYKVNDVVKKGPSLWIATAGHSSATFDTANWIVWIPGQEYVNVWDVAVEYDLGDIVSYGGYSYTSKTANNLANVPSVDSVHWLLLTQGYRMIGDWSSTVPYKVGDVVRRGGSIFSAIQDNTSQDPSGSIVTKTYDAGGSSGTTMVLNDSAGVVVGQLVTGIGFTQGQNVTDVNIDGVTITLSDGPNGTPQGGSPMTFTGMNPNNWKIVTTGNQFKNRWTTGIDFVVGDIVILGNTTYVCTANHSSSSVIKPDTDVNNQYWQIYLYHARYNALTSDGDLETFNGQQRVPIPVIPGPAIGVDGDEMLVADNGLPIWKQINVIPKVFYVTPNGIDNMYHGTTWDRPWGSIKYACDVIAEGTNFPYTSGILAVNRGFLSVEAAAWMTYQIDNAIAPFDTNPTIDIEKAIRDAGLLVDAIAYDLSRGGNSQTVEDALSYFAIEGGTNKFINATVTAQMPYFIAMLTYLKSMIDLVSLNLPVLTNYQALNLVPPSSRTLQVFDSQFQNENNSQLEIGSLYNIVITALTNQDKTAIPPKNQGLTATIMVKTGTYTETLPITIPANVALNGDELRGVLVTPKVSFRTVATRTVASSSTIELDDTSGLEIEMPIQFAELDSENAAGVTNSRTDLDLGTTYYVASIANGAITVSTAPGNSPITLNDNVFDMNVYAGDMLKDMFRVRNATGIRNMTLKGLYGQLGPENANFTRRPTGGSFVALDPGTGPDDSSAWIIRRSPYIQNVTTFGYGCTGCKIDGNLHNGGNKSMVSNDFTQIIGDGIGVWCTGPGSLTELVSVFAYYGYAGYMAEGGGRIRATNGNTSYGTYGVIAEGYDSTEVPVTGSVYNRSSQVQASVQSSFGANARLVALNFKNSGSAYNQTTTNMVQNSNAFTSWTNDGNITLQQNLVAPNGYAEAWTITGATSTNNSDYLYKNIAIQPAGASYSAVPATNISGSGVNATFDIVVTSTGYTVTVNAGGSGYVAGADLYISGSVLGGQASINDCFITVASLSGSSILTVTNTGVVPTGSALSYTLSLYAKQGTAATIDIQGIFSGSSTVTSGVTFNFATGTLTPYNVTAGFVPVQYNKITYTNGWYRIWVAVNDTTGLNSNLQFRIYPRGKSGTSTYNYIFGAQAEISSATYTPNFYLETTTNMYTTYANMKVVGAGSGAILVADELRSGAVFETRVTDTGSGEGGSGYLTASNASQGGDTTLIQLAASNTNTAAQLVGMRVFINSGTGAGQYGYISAFDFVNKYAEVLKESFDEVTVTATNSVTDELTVSSTIGLYVNQMIQFIPTTYTTAITTTAVDKIVVTGTLGGVINTFTVASTARLRQNMSVTFTGTIYGGVTTDFNYYITEILSDTTFQVSTTFGGTVWQLLTGTPGPQPMYVSFPTNDSYINGSTTNMVPNMPIQFTGASIGGISVGSDYYVSEVIDSTTFSIASSLLTLNVSATDSVAKTLTVDTTTNGMVPFTPIYFSGTTIGGLVEGTKYYISKIVDGTKFQVTTSFVTTTARISEQFTNLITVDSTAGFVANNAITFIGTTFGDIVTEKTYYIQVINDATTFTISTVPNGTAVNLTTAVGELVVRAAPASSLPSATATGGSMTAITTPAKVAIGAGYGNMIASFSTNLFGNVTSGTTYYITAINSGKITISTAQGGGTFQLSTKTGSMNFGEVGWDHITPGTPIASVLDSSSVYYVEPKTTFSSPGYSQTVTTGVSLSPGNSWKAIAYGENKWVAIPESGQTAAVTTNGTVWTSLVLTSNYTWQDIAYGNKYWVIISSGGTGNSKVLYSASAGAGWKTANLPSATTWSKVVYGNGKFVTIARATGTSAYSTDFGKTWQSGNNLPIAAWTSIAYGNGMFMAVADGATNVAAYSTDGINWNSITLPISGDWSAVKYGNGRFIAVSSTLSNSLYTFNGTTWYQSVVSIQASLLEYGQGIFVALRPGVTQAYTSEDGTHWKTRITDGASYGDVKFGFSSSSYDGMFVTLAGTSTGSKIFAGSRAKGRPVITSGTITSVVLWEAGSNYTVAPSVTFTDPNVTTLASVSPRIGNGSLGNPTFYARGTGYTTASTVVNIDGSGYSDSYQTGLTIIVNNLTKLPQPGDNLVINGVSQIFKVTSATAAFGTTAPSIEANIQVAPDIKVINSTANGTIVTIRQKYSQVRLTGHDFLNVGYGNQTQSNYPGYPTDTVLAPQDQAVEADFGRVFYTSTDQDGNFKVGSLFAVEQATGIITLSASQFGLSGLETLSLGGISVGGQSVVIRQFSTDATFVANSNEILVTQKAIKSYLTSRLSQGGSNTFTGQLIAGTVLVGGPDKIASTIPEGTLGSNIKMLNKVMVNGPGGNSGWGGDGAALAFFVKTWHRR